jgi:hypothetical protein
MTARTVAHLTERHWSSFPFGVVTETESPPSSKQAENTNEAATTRLMHRARRYRTLHYPCVLLRAGRGEPENGIQHKRGLPLGWLLSTTWQRHRLLSLPVCDGAAIRVSPMTAYPTDIVGGLP